ncbi:hypothetical protein LXA43DRAFT_952775 [Ganoderma leucocontextum]|nr:hypothetical protein LXA43DRAFT_952775 [Ganoderma leucocontextum]
MTGSSPSKYRRILSKYLRISNDVLNPEPSLSTSSTAPSNSTPNFDRHAEFWFEDGNIILVARDTGFRIYRGLLASQSAVFSDMFASSNSQTNETFEGCPTVPLSDSPEDLTHLLRVLIPKNHITYTRNHTPKAAPCRTLDEISAFIRLADKYDIRHVQDQAMAALKEYFPGDFDTFNLSGAPGGDSIPSLATQAIGAVNLARLTDMPSILPLALYQCAHLEGVLLDGWKRKDGTVEHLSPADLRRCIDARRALIWAHVRLVFRLFDGHPSAGCTSRAWCTEKLRVFLGLIVTAVEIADSDPSENWTAQSHPLEGWTEGLRQLGDEASLCKSCVEELIRRSYQERKKVWNRLPKIFNVAVAGWGQ